MMLPFFTILHPLVDACSVSVLVVGGMTWERVIAYNAIAFALQLPIGILTDHFVAESTDSKQKIPFLLISAGILLTVIGCFTNPVILGLGNALFHTGGGIVSIQEDDHAGMKGAGLGVFVAPGAIGLFLGRVIADASRWGKVLKDAGGVLRDKELGFPMKELRPATRWNYVLVADGPDGGIVFGEHGRGLERYLTVKAVRTHYAGWGTMSATAPARAEDPPPCPVPRSAVYGTPAEVRLVPIAFTQLRITLFPWTHAFAGTDR
jgi:hypothetical protein